MTQNRFQDNPCPSSICFALGWLNFYCLISKDQRERYTYNDIPFCWEKSSSWNQLSLKLAPCVSTPICLISRMVVLKFKLESFNAIYRIIGKIFLNFSNTTVCIFLLFIYSSSHSPLICFCPRYPLNIVVKNKTMNKQKTNYFLWRKGDRECVRACGAYLAEPALSSLFLPRTLAAKVKRLWQSVNQQRRLKANTQLYSNFHQTHFSTKIRLWKMLFWEMWYAF